LQETFETKVLTKLAVIETELKGHSELKKIIYDTERRSIKNEAEIQEIKDNNKWLKRAVIGAIIATGATAVFGFIFIGLGVG